MPRSTDRSQRQGRRGVLRAALALSLAPLAPPARGQSLEPTPRDAEGPFYPRSFPADVDADLTRIAGRAGVAKGTPLELTGTVATTDGAPLAGAIVELWQCDAYGTYHHVGETGRLDPDFQGYGRTIADADGRFAFRTIRPVPYGGRPAHLHFKLAHPRARSLTTQLYLNGESSERYAAMFARERERLEIAPAASTREPGALAAHYRFVLER
ncbi:MAG: intradiol ring-cleavage dioxygenase [Burkholderiales bacterium]